MFRFSKKKVQDLEDVRSLSTVCPWFTECNLGQCQLEHAKNDFLQFWLQSGIVTFIQRPNCTHTKNCNMHTKLDTAGRNLDFKKEFCI